MRLQTPIRKQEKVTPDEFQKVYDELRQSIQGFQGGDMADASHYMHGVAQLSRDLADRLFVLAGIETDEIMIREFGHPRD